MSTKTSRSSSPITDKQERLALAAAHHAAFDGWTEAALKIAAQEIGIKPGEISLLFPGGIKDWITAFETVMTNRMLHKIQSHAGFAALRIREKIAFSIRTRLELLQPYTESIRRLQTALLFPPSRALLALSLAHKLTDAIWRAAGDASTDFNYYTKRGLLTGVYVATQIFWLNDDSANHAASWAFLDRRISNVLKLGQAIGRFKKTG